MKKKALTKSLALAMAVVMAGSMVGCGNDSGTQESQSSDTNQESSEGGSSEETPSDDTTSGDETPSDDAADGEETPDEEAAASDNQPLPEWEAYDCNGATIRIAAEQIFDSTTETDKEDPTKSANYEKKWEYLHALEEKYNCKFEMVNLDNSSGYDEGEAILNTFTNGLAYADIFMKGPGVMLQCRNYLATVDDRDRLKMGSAFIDAASWNGVDYGFTYDNIGECFVLCYSRDYLSDIGMEKTPGDMFAEGKWSYDDAKEYFAELQSKLPEGSYCIGLACNQYGFMAGGTNGVMGITLDGQINLDDERYIAALNFYNELEEAGYAAPITGFSEGADNTLVEADDSSMPYTLSDMCGYSGANTHVLANVQNWQHGDPAANGTNWGIVPYPWGPECEVTGYEDYTDPVTGEAISLPVLSNYFVARVDFTNVLVAGADYRGEGSKDIPDWVLFQIVREYEDMRSVNSTQSAGMTPGTGSGQAWINSYTAEKNGGSAGNVNFSPDDMRQFTDGMDVAIWNWVSSNVKIDYCNALNGSSYVPFSRNAYLVIGANKDAKASGEALKALGEANLKEQGLK